MQLYWRGYYLDGITAVRQPAAITITQTGLQIAKTDGSLVIWQYAEVNQTQGFYEGEQVRLEKGKETLIIPDTAFLRSLRLAAPSSSGKFHNPAFRKKRVWWIVAAAIVVVTALTAAYMWIIPFGAGILAEHVPLAWEAKLGDAVVKELVKHDAECSASLPKEAVDRIMQALNAAAPKHPYKFHIYLVKDKTVNTLAAPGGNLILFTGLLEQTKSAEELAGVLAHEMQHVLQKHTTKGIIQNLSTTALMSVALGDAGIAGDAVRTLGNLHYSRAMEEEADLRGMELLIKAGINPNGMIDIFDTLSKKYGNEPELFKYVSTHPLMADRIKKLKTQAEAASFTPILLLPDISWPQLVKSCEAAGDKQKTHGKK